MQARLSFIHPFPNGITRVKYRDKICNSILPTFIKFPSSLCFKFPSNPPRNFSFPKNDLREINFYILSVYLIVGIQSVDLSVQFRKINLLAMKIYIEWNSIHTRYFIPKIIPISFRLTNAPSFPFFFLFPFPFPLPRQICNSFFR